MTLLEQIKEVMSDHSGPAHVDAISDMLLSRFSNEVPDAVKLIDRVSSVLSADTRKKGGRASFSRLKNKQGGFRRGMYKLKVKPVVKPKPTLAPSVSSLYTGKAGEAAVLSELLFYGFNASSMTIDDGIDIVASKNNNYFHIQVKTANPSSEGAFAFSIKKSSFTSKNTSQTFYVFVLRESDTFRYFNDYLILPSSQIRQLVEVGIIKDGQSLSVRIQKSKKGTYLLNAKQDVTISVNTFSQIL